MSLQSEALKNWGLLAFTSFSMTLIYLLCVGLH